MADYTRYEITTTVIEYRIPTGPHGAAWVEVHKAVAAAHAELQAAGELAEGRDAADDQIRIESRDEEIVVSFEAPAVQQ